MGPAYHLRKNRRYLLPASFDLGSTGEPSVLPKTAPTQPTAGPGRPSYPSPWSRPSSGPPTAAPSPNDDQCQRTLCRFATFRYLGERFGASSPGASGLGRVIAAVVMTTGVGFLALLTGSLAQRFVRGGSDAATPKPAPSEAETLRRLGEMSD